MRAPRATVFVILLLGVGAREQCVPGPFEYDPDGSGDEDLPSDGCFDPQCRCDDDADCRQFFGPDSRCVSGECRTRQTCTLGDQEQFCANADETCAHDPASLNPEFEGLCLPVAPSPAAAGEPCSTDDRDVNPCGGGAFCLVTDGSQGFCVEGCDANGSCGAGFNCSTPFSTFGGRLLCMPACDLDNPVCGDGRFVCMLAQGLGGTSCTPDNGACLLAGCDSEGCDDLCPGGSECDDGTFCIESVVFNCREDAPEQTSAVCSPPGEENQPCVLTEPGSCVDGLACSPFGFDVTANKQEAQCVQQSANPAADGGSCDPNDSVNRCEPGAYCARGGDGGGVCQRFCDDASDCDAGFDCARANLQSEDPAQHEAFGAVRVCAEPCLAGDACPSGLTCDVDAAVCTGPGFCVPPESLRPCAGQADCDLVTGTVCSGDNYCTLPDDVCAAQECVLTDPLSCSAGFACSPFGSAFPKCVPQVNVVGDGELCSRGGTTTSCEQGSVCSDTCQRFCLQDTDCDAPESCVRGNLIDNLLGKSDDVTDPFRLFDLKVCATTCTASTGCGGGLSCDVDGDASCVSGGGFCLAFENSPQEGCAADDECAAFAGTVCTSNGCLPPEDRCTP